MDTTQLYITAAGTIITLLIGVVSYLWKNSEKIKSEDLKENFTFIKESLKETQDSIKDINKDRFDVAAKLAEDNKTMAQRLTDTNTSIALQFSTSNAITALAISNVKELAVKAITQNDSLIRNQDLMLLDINDLKKKYIITENVLFNVPSDIKLKIQ